MFVLTLIKLQIREEAPCRLWSGDATLARGGIRVRGQRTPEVNKVALIALKYFNALIAAKLIASINALTLTALTKTNNKKYIQDVFHFEKMWNDFIVLFQIHTLYTLAVINKFQPNVDPQCLSEQGHDTWASNRLDNRYSLTTRAPVWCLSSISVQTKPNPLLFSFCKAQQSWCNYSLCAFVDIFIFTNWSRFEKEKNSNRFLSFIITAPHMQRARGWIPAKETWPRATRSCSIALVQKKKTENLCSWFSVGG